MVFYIEWFPTSNGFLHQMVSCIKWFSTSNGSETFLWLQPQYPLSWFWKSQQAWKKRTLIRLAPLRIDHLPMIMMMIRLTWRERRESLPHWWWRTQWGVPWFHQRGSAEPPSWSSCLSRCCRRSPCQSRSAPAEELIEEVPLLVL